VSAQSVFQAGRIKVPRPLLLPFLKEYPTGAPEQQGVDEMNPTLGSISCWKKDPRQTCLTMTTATSG
jgi:hypothetical protein